MAPSLQKPPALFGTAALPTTSYPVAPAYAPPAPSQDLAVPIVTPTKPLPGRAVSSKISSSSSIQSDEHAPTSDRVRALEEALRQKRMVEEEQELERQRREHAAQEARDRQEKEAKLEALRAARTSPMHGAGVVIPRHSSRDLDPSSHSASRVGVCIPWGQLTYPPVLTAASPPRCLQSPATQHLSVRPGNAPNRALLNGAQNGLDSSLESEDLPGPRSPQPSTLARRGASSSSPPGSSGNRGSAVPKGLVVIYPRSPLRFHFDRLATKAGLKGEGCIGLRNLGNTCYFNSVMQCLANLPEVLHAFLSPGSEASRSHHPLTAVFQSWLEDYWSGDRYSSLSPSGLIRELARKDQRWGDRSQQDAQELLHCLLGGLQHDTNRVKGKAPYRELAGKGDEAQQADEALRYFESRSSSLVDDIFGGVLQSRVECRQCGNVTYCFDPFLDLSLPIPASSGAAALLSSRTTPFTVTEALDCFTEEERLDRSEGYKCERCKVVCPIRKRLLVQSWPQVLVVHLKRFKGSGTGFSSRRLLSSFSMLSLNKNSAPLDLAASRELDLSRYCSRTALEAAEAPPLYELAGFSSHSGSLGGGHYTAYARNPADNRWYHFNDSDVSKGEPDRQSGGPYLLFYRLCNN